MKIAIIVPMPIEAGFYSQYFQKGSKQTFGMTTFDHYEFKNHEVYLGLSGIGKVQAAMNLTALLSHVAIDLIIVTGSAGSLKNTVQQNDLILADRVAYHDVFCTQAGDYTVGQLPGLPPFFALDNVYKQHFVNFLKQRRVAFQEGLIVTGDTFVSSTAQKQQILKHFPEALAVEMEGAAFAQVAYRFKKPLIILRAISDNGDKNANQDFEAFVRKVGAKAAELNCAFLENEI